MSFDVPIINDGIPEGNEDFTVTIDPSSLPNGVTPGTSNSATVTIRDDESKYITTPCAYYCSGVFKLSFVHSCVYVSYTLCIYSNSSDMLFLVPVKCGRGTQFSSISKFLL